MPMMREMAGRRIAELEAEIESASSLEPFLHVNPETMRILETEMEAMWESDSDEIENYRYADPPIITVVREEKKDKSLKIIAEQYIDKDLNCI